MKAQPFTSYQPGTNVKVTFPLSDPTFVSVYESVEDAEHDNPTIEVFSCGEFLIGEIRQNEPDSEWLLIECGDGSIALISRQEVDIEETDQLF
ncbi:MAG: hypothetical protein DDT31_01019 [Syntrophomonadaceae bacterium]|nr:hypothetical protein [Bacillota bacterium]